VPRVGTSAISVYTGIRMSGRQERPHTPSLAGLGSATLEEVERQLRICDSCRYCEAYCPVFPALERRPARAASDLIFLGNLCHDCEACFQACMYTEPHEFGMNLPAALSGVRAETYEQYAWPTWLARRVGSSVTAPLWMTLFAVVVIAAGLTLSGSWGRLLVAHSGAGAFYQVVPFLLMMIPSLAGAVFIIGILGVGTLRFWFNAGGRLSELTNLGIWTSATRDSITLTNMRGGGGGCYVPDPDRPSPTRRRLHTFVVGGFTAALISTILAAFWQELLHQMPPYPILSPTVIVGIIGGVALILGTTPLLYLKVRTGRQFSAPAMRQMDFTFLLLLDGTSFSGMLTLILRSSSAMGVMLDLHIALLFALYLTAPYGKFAHSVFRFAALALDVTEKRRAAAVQPPHAHLGKSVPR